MLRTALDGDPDRIDALNIARACQAIGGEDRQDDRAQRTVFPAAPSDICRAAR